MQREPKPLTEEQVAKLAAEVPDRYRALVWTLAEQGARIGELVALRVRNLNGTIRIAENAPIVNGQHVIGSPKTEGSVREVPISPMLRPILREHLNTYANRFDPDSPVFTTDRGKMIRQDLFLKRVLKPAAERAGIEGFTTHWLCHTAISLWLTRGLTPFEVAKMVGHADLAMIERRYGHLYVGELAKKMERLSRDAR